MLSVLGVNKGEVTLFDRGFRVEQRESLPLDSRLNWGPCHGTKQALEWAVTALDNLPRWTLRKVIKKSAESSNKWPGPGEGLNAAWPFMCRAMPFWHRHPWKKRQLGFGMEGSLSSQEDKNQWEEPRRKRTAESGDPRNNSVRNVYDYAVGEITQETDQTD